MARQHVYGIVSAEEWQRIGDEDTARRAAIRPTDTRSSVLTGIAALLALAMLAIGPIWTLIDVLGGAREHGPSFDSLWLLPLVLTFAAAIPLAWALHRERNHARISLAILLVVSVGIQLATCPWL